MVFSNNLLMGAAAAASSGDAGYVPKGAIWLNGSDEYLHWTPSSTATSSTKKTLSFWFKRSALGSVQWLIDAGSNNDQIQFAAADDLEVSLNATTDAYLNTTAVYRDPTAWMHIVVSFDTGAGVSSVRMRLWINGEEVTAFDTSNYPSASYALDFMADTVQQNIGRRGNNSQFYNGYISEFIGLDGYAGLASDFAQYDSNGVWVPKDPTTIVTANKGTNGFWLDFADSSDLGKDVSSGGNDNSFTSVNMGTANSTLDRPADEAEDTGNYCTLSSVYKVGTGQYLPVSNGNLTFTNVSFGRGTQAMGTIGMSSGKFYWEVSWSAIPNELASRVGIAQIDDVVGSGSLDGAGTQYLAGTAGSWAFLAWESGANAGKKETNGTKSSYYDSTTDISDTIGVAFDADNGAIWISKNGSWIDGSVTGQSSATVLASIETYANTYVMFDGLTDGPYIPGVSFDGSPGTGEINFGQTAFTYTPPSGFKKLNTSNMSEPTVKNGEDNFSPILFEGNGKGQRVGNFIPFTDSHTVNYSARFDAGSSQYLTRTPSSSGNRRTWTFSAWVKRGQINTLSGVHLFGADRTGGYGDRITFGNGDTDDRFNVNFNDAGDGRLQTYRYFQDASVWTNFVVAVDTTQSTNTDRVKIYINGVLVTSNLLATANYPTQNYDTMMNYTTAQMIGARGGSASQFMDGYMAEVVMIDGTQLAASSFGQTDTSTNRWIPKDVSGLTFGTNGFYLNMADKNDLGDDESGNGNDFTETNMDTTNGSNQMYDTPTRNFNVLNPADSGGGTLTEGNLKITPANLAGIRATIGIGLNTGKYYWESVQGASGGEVGWYSEDCNVSTSGGGQSNGAGNWNINFNGRFHSNPIGGTLTTSSDQTAWAFTTGDVIMCAYDSDTGNLWFGKNGTWFDSVSGSSGNTGNPSTGANPFLTGVNTKIFPMVGDGTGTAANIQTVNFGSWIYFDSTTLSLSTGPAGYFRHTVPTDFKAINQDNLPENTAGITGFAWFKERDGTTNHLLWDRVNGIYKYIISNTNDVQGTDTNGLKSFLQQGADVGNMSSINDDGDSMVLWQWVAGGTSTPSVNTDAGFSIAKYTGNGSAGNTVTHSLTVDPEFICVKKLAAGDDSTSRHWAVYHVSQGNTKYALLSDSNAFATSSGYWNNVTPGTSTFTVGTDDSVNGNNAPYVAYCWAGVDGYSQFGEYIGNGNADGPIINLGFKPSFVLIKAAERSNNWHIFDSARNPYNPITNNALFPDLDLAEGGTNSIDFGGSFFKLRTSEVWLNASSSNKYIYAAFASNPFGGSGVAQGKAR